jgi:sulfatase modifying factor 1
VVILIKHKLCVLVIIGILLITACGCSKDEKRQKANLPMEIIGKDGAEMVLIPAGEFQMGTGEWEVPGLLLWAKKWYEGPKSKEPESSMFEDQTPRHTVYLDAFYIDRYEVTNTLYRKFMDATGHGPPGFWHDSRYNAPNQPVVGVSWHDAKAYTKWADKRLPTEAEWEKAARGGLAGKRYAWGDNISHDKANYRGEFGKDRWEYTAPVGSFASNGYGLYNMSGNVWEWCADWYSRDYYAKSPKENPEGPASGMYRVSRGSSWNLDASWLLVAFRDKIIPELVTYCHGFRCAKDVKP